MTSREQDLAEALKIARALERDLRADWRGTDAADVLLCIISLLAVAPKDDSLTASQSEGV